MDYNEVEKGEDSGDNEESDFANDNVVSGVKSDYEPKIVLDGELSVAIDNDND